VEKSSLEKWAAKTNEPKGGQKCWLCHREKLSADIWQVFDMIESGESKASLAALFHHLVEEYDFPRSESSFRSHLRNHRARRP